MGQSVWYAWWYLSIALGFIALAVRQMIVGGNRTGIVLRLIIAAGFAALSWLTFRQSSRDR
jgi:hypothetical protein